MAEGEPLALRDFAVRLAEVVSPQASGLVLAVSGGPDSMALLLLVAALRRQTLLPPIVVGTVDHGLRPGSAEETARVEAAANAQGLACRRLIWSGAKPARAMQEKAREARYGLLTALCTEIGADHLLTAHTGDDQAETVLFRLLRGSGWAGLAGMAPRTQRGGVTLARPLLGIVKARLVATCRAAGVLFCQDPANADTRFARARIRGVLPLLAAEGFDSAALVRLAGRVGRAENALQHAAGQAAQACRWRGDADSAGRLDAKLLVAMPRELTIRVLGQAVAEAGGAARRLDRLERLAERIAAAVHAGTGWRATLGGAIVTLRPDGLLEVVREGPRLRGAGSPASMRSGQPQVGTVRFPWQA